MQGIIGIITGLGIVWALAFFRVSRHIWPMMFGIFLFILSIFSSIAWFILLPFWLVFLLIVALANSSALQIILLKRFMLAKIQRLLPAISNTEREALEAGDTWWEGELFSGKPNWQILLNLPKPQLSKVERTFLENQVAKLCSMLDDWQITQNGDLPKEVWDYLKKEKFFGLVIDKEYEGHGFSALAHSAVISKIASRSLSAAITTMVPNSLGPGELLQRYGTAEQKKYYLPRLATGEEIPCFALTGLEAGSDATAMTDTGVVCKARYQGEEKICLRLNWDKRYITLAPVATLIGVAFKMYDPENLLGNVTDIGITICLVSSNHLGVELGDRHLPVHMAFMNGPVRGKDVIVPIDSIIGGIAMRGKGWKMLMECLSVGRGISLPALATAGGKICFRTTGAYATCRQQFKMSIGQFEGVQEGLARIGGLTYLCEATRLLTTVGIDQGIKPSLATAISKYHLTEFSRIIINDAMNIHGGRGVQIGSRNYLVNLYDSIPVSVTVEGANILTRNLIIFGQGALRCHPYVLREMQILQKPHTKQMLHEFGSLLIEHVGFAISNFFRVFAYGITGGYFVRSPVADVSKKYYRQLARMSVVLALVSDIALLTLGGELKRKERLSARLGDVLSYLYLASAVLKYNQDQGRSDFNALFTNWAVKFCLFKTQAAIIDFLDNFPMRSVAWILRRIIFPWGNCYRKPSDKLENNMSLAMMQLSDWREQVLSDCFFEYHADDPIGRVELAFKAVLGSEPIRIKLKNAVHDGKIAHQNDLVEMINLAIKAGVLTAQESKLLLESEQLRMDALRVDEFKENILM